ncbi:MAG: hypothetical protein R2867_05260 [Caldilineaceae bacterium]
MPQSAGDTGVEATSAAYMAYVEAQREQLRFFQQQYTAATTNIENSEPTVLVQRTGDVPDGTMLVDNATAWATYAQRLTGLFEQGPPTTDEGSAFAVTNAGLSQADAEATTAATAAYNESLLLAAQTNTEISAAQQGQAAVAAEAQSLATESLTLIPEPAVATGESLLSIPEPATATAAALTLLPTPIGAAITAIGGLAGAVAAAIARIQAAASAVANAAAAARSAASGSAPTTSNTVTPGGLQARAAGGPISGTALVGEEGAEIAYNAARGTAVLVGASGPELRNFDPGTSIIPAGTTARVLSRGVRSAVGGAGLAGAAGATLTAFAPQIAGYISRIRGSASGTAEAAETMLDAAYQQGEAAMIAAEQAEEGAALQTRATNSIREGVTATRASIEQINDALKRSAVTADDIAATQRGEYKDKADEFVRRLAAAANGSGFQETLGQAADALEAAGFTPETDPKALYEQFTKAWDDRTLFYAEQNLALINTAAIAEQGQAAQAAAAAQAMLDEKAAIGVQNLQSYLGQFIDTSVAGVGAALGVSTGDIGATQEGAGGDGSSTAATGINEAISALSEALSGLASLVSDSVNAAMSGLAERTNATFDPLNGLASRLGSAASRVSSFSSVVESAIEEIRTLLRGSPDAAPTTTDPVATAGSGAAGGVAAGRFLVGETGREIWFNAARRESGIVGANGPQIVDFAPGTRIYSNPETEQILARSGGSNRPIFTSAQLGFDPGLTSGGSSSGVVTRTGASDVSRILDALTTSELGSFTPAPSGFFRNSPGSTLNSALSGLAPLATFASTARRSSASRGLGASISRSGSSRRASGRFTELAEQGSRLDLVGPSGEDDGLTEERISSVVRTAVAKAASPISRIFTASFRGHVSPQQTRVVYNINNTINSNNNVTNSVDYGGLNVQSVRSSESVSADFNTMKLLYG